MKKESYTPKGFYNRGYLPHFDGGTKPQFITMRLFDSLPQKVLEKWKIELESLDDDEITLRKRIEKYLDIGYGKCFLKNSEVAKIVQDSLLFHHEKSGKLVSWVIMPNHVHFLFVPFENVELETVMHSIKSFTAHEANRVLNRTGKVWQIESYDRYIRTNEHYSNVIRYIEQNPVKASCAKKRRIGSFQVRTILRICRFV